MRRTRRTRPAAQRAPACVRAAVTLAALSVSLPTPSPAADHVFVVGAGTFDAPGTTAALEITAPWTSQIALGDVGRMPRVRHAAGFHYVVNGSTESTVQVIDASTFETVQVIPVGPDTDPRDIAVLEDGTAYVSRFRSPWLLRVDLETGARIDSLDLGLFADPDGLPDLAMMARDGDRLFIQVQRRDQVTSWQVVPPSMLAVVDVTAHALVDVDPTAPGVQAIELTGPLPDHDMSVLASERRLYVSTPGNRLDVSGGIEVIDLDALASLGFAIDEKATIGDLGAVLVVSPTKGYLIAHTDIIASTHLFAFSPANGTITSSEIYFTTNYVQHMAYDAPTAQLFVPDTDRNGVVVVDGETDEVLTPMPVPVGPRPVDIVVVRQGTVGVEDPGMVAAAPAALVWPNPVHRGGSVALRGLIGRADVFDAAGRHVRALALSRRGQGLWDTKNARGRLVAPGVYYVRSDGEHTRRIVVR